jgi:hypothetical protein
MHRGAHPPGQLGISAVGVWQTRSREIGPSTPQQIWPAAQQLVPQQVPFAQVVPDSQGAAVQAPLSQNGVAEGH